MRVFVALPVALTLLSCTGAESPRTPAASAADTCALLELAEDALFTAVNLTEEERILMRAIDTTAFAPPSYRCDDVSYATDRSREGIAFTAIGIRGDRRYARMQLQSVSRSFPSGGYSCLYENTAETWELRGCDFDWIS